MYVSRCVWGNKHFVFLNLCRNRDIPGELSGIVLVEGGWELILPRGWAM